MNTWGRARKRDPQEGPYRQQGCWQTVRNHNTTECRRFNENGSRKDRLTKPFDSANKHWNKPGNGDPDQISHLTEEIAKLEKKLAKSKRHSKKRARESPDNDSDDNLDIGSSSTGS